MAEFNKTEEISTGYKLTIEGPASYDGDILEDPELLWADDEWDDERVKAAQERVREQGAPLPPYWYEQYTSKANKHWGQFYKRNGDRFYKDRHYLHAEFPEVLERGSDACGMRLLEVGCGVGNAVIPLLELNPSLQVYAIDFANSAIDLLRQNQLAVDGRLVCSVCDVVQDDLPVDPCSVDLVLCMFVLSAISPEQQQAVIVKLSRCLKVGGKLLFRDYGRYDEAQLRFKKNSLLKDNFYVRQDGTCAYYFELEELNAMCVTAGLMPIEERCKYVRRQMANRQQKKARYRVWIQAAYEKAAGDSF